MKKMYKLPPESGKKWTKQEAFDAIVQHLSGMKQRSGTLDFAERFKCLYRGPDGAMCAIGCLIPNDEYKREMEGVDIEGVDLVSTLPCLSSLTKEEKIILSSLQQIHDSFINWNETGFAAWNEIAEIGRMFGCDTSCVDKFLNGMPALRKVMKCLGR